MRRRAVAAKFLGICIAALRLGLADLRRECECRLHYWTLWRARTAGGAHDGEQSAWTGRHDLEGITTMASIARRADGRWRARYRDDLEKEHARHFGRKAEAQRWLDETAATVVAGTYVDPKAGLVTFASFYAQWAQRQVWTSNTHLAMGLAVRCTTFAELELNKIRTSHVEHWVKMMNGTLAASTIKTRFVNVRSVFRAAVRDRMIPVDPSIGVRLPRQRKREAQMRIPTPDDVRQALEAADDRFGPFVAVCAFAGLRLGEAAALQLADVDFLRRTISVRRQVQRAGRGTVEIRLPKYSSERTVYVPEELVQMLARLVASGIREPWLFAEGSDTPPHQNTIGHRWRQTLVRAGLDPIKLHDLRHFYASGLIADGCDVVTVQRALGHAKATTTLDTYSHLWPTAEDKTRRAAASMMSAVLHATVRPSAPGERRS